MRTNRYVGIEIGLALVAVALNVAPHWVPAGHWSGHLVWLVVPAGLTFTAYLVPKLVTDTHTALTHHTTTTGDRGDRDRDRGDRDRLAEMTSDAQRVRYAVGVTGHDRAADVVSWVTGHGYPVSAEAARSTIRRMRD